MHKIQINYDNNKHNNNTNNQKAHLKKKTGWNLNHHTNSI
jgi:hypothetical protein